MAYFYLNDYTATSGFIPLFASSGYGTSYGGFAMYYINSSPTPIMYVYGHSNGSMYVKYDSPVLYTYTWHHVCVIMNSTEPRIFVDGNQLNINLNQSYSNSLVVQDVYIAGRPGFNTNAYIDEVYIYKGSLSTHEIRKIMNLHNTKNTKMFIYGQKLEITDSTTYYSFRLTNSNAEEIDGVYIIRTNNVPNQNLSVLFDGDITTRYVKYKPSYGGSIDITLQLPTRLRLDEIYIYARDNDQSQYYPQSVALSVSNDGSTYVSIDVQYNIFPFADLSYNGHTTASETEQNVIFSNNAAYKYYKFSFSNSAHGDYIVLSDLKFMVYVEKQRTDIILS
jgi:hypothetical protein